MLILPAIDLRAGRCVRLRQGDYTRETVFSDDPAAMAASWVGQGARHLHLVDLDGAKQGRPVNGAAIRRIVEAAGVPCQLGGGLRTEQDLEHALGWGVQRLVLGTRVLQDPAWSERMCRRFPGQIVLGLDAKDGQVATHGWLEVSAQSAVDVARHCSAWPLAAIVYTDITRDGMLEGPNLEATANLVREVSFPVIASGGISTADDVRQLAKAGVFGCIIGRALYEGRLRLAEVLEQQTVGESRRA